MFQPHSITPDSPFSTTWGRPLLERQVELLGRIAEAGVDMALILRDEVKAAQADASAAPPFEPGAADGGEPPVAALHASMFHAFDRVTRGVRLALMLQEKLITALQQADLGLVQMEAAAAVERLPERKAEITRIAVRIGERQGWPYPRTEQAMRDRLERDFCGDILTRPYSEILADLCKDIGLAVDWPHMAREAWAVEEMLSGRAGWPLEGYQSPKPEAADREAEDAGEPAPHGASP